MKSVASTNIPSKCFHPHQTPDWDDELKLAQRAANKAHKAWCSGGKSRNPDHPLHVTYKNSKHIFWARLGTHRKNLMETFFSKLDLINTDSRKPFWEIGNLNGHPIRTIPNHFIQWHYLQMRHTPWGLGFLFWTPKCPYLPQYIQHLFLTGHQWGIPVPPGHWSRWGNSLHTWGDRRSHQNPQIPKGPRPGWDTLSTLALQHTIYSLTSLMQ